MKKVLIVLAILCLVIGVAGFATLRMINYWPAPVIPGAMLCKKEAPVMPKSKTSLRVLSWNVQYSASRKYHFFYDGGKAVIASKADVEETLKQIIQVSKEYDPDIILLQELDVDSDRSARIDQLEAMWKALPYACRADTPYFKSRYVPTPGVFSGAMGRVDTRLVVFSKYKINKATRLALPMLKESFVRRAFNLKRAVLATEIALEGGKTFTVFNTHFSAFSHGDGTMEKQVARFAELLADATKKGHHWVAAGDLNLLPPGDSPKRLKKDNNLYADKKNPITPLFKQFTSALSLTEYKKSPDKYNTYIPYGDQKTDRWIDHVFVSKSLHVTKYNVPQKHYNISDHLPIVIDIALGPKPAAAPAAPAPTKAGAPDERKADERKPADERKADERKADDRKADDR